jgi:putative transposase
MPRSSWRGSKQSPRWPRPADLPGREWLCPQPARDVQLGAKCHRKRIPYENPEGRRVNALAALLRTAAGADLVWTTKPKAFVAEEVVQFLRELPPAQIPTVVVLDNAGIHRSTVVRAARAGLWRRGIYLYYLPPYSPELHAIEPVFRVIKHDELPARRYPTVAALTAAIDTGFTNYRTRLHAKSRAQPGQAA